jgi:hypothetical protein
VTKIRIPYYVIVAGRGYWRTTPKMQAKGFSTVRRGPDGTAAWAIAENWNRRWQAVRKGEAPAPIDTYAPVDLEAVRNTDIARVQGRRKIRAGNESGVKSVKTTGRKV